MQLLSCDVVDANFFKMPLNFIQQLGIIPDLLAANLSRISIRVVLSFQFVLEPLDCFVDQFNWNSELLAYLQGFQVAFNVSFNDAELLGCQLTLSLLQMWIEWITLALKH